jgi:hypothetical protein
VGGEEKSWLESIIRYAQRVSDGSCTVKEGATRSEPRHFHLPKHENDLLSSCTVLPRDRQHPLRVLIVPALCGCSCSLGRTVSFNNFYPVYMVIWREWQLQTLASSCYVKVVISRRQLGRIDAMKIHNSFPY